MSDTRADQFKVEPKEACGRIAALVVPTASMKTQETNMQNVETLATKLGFCTTCGTMFSHEFDGPYANCECGTSEWYEYTPYMQLEKKIMELKRERDALKQELELAQENKQ